MNHYVIGFSVFAVIQATFSLILTLHGDHVVGLFYGAVAILNALAAYHYAQKK